MDPFSIAGAWGPLKYVFGWAVSLWRAFRCGLGDFRNPSRCVRLLEASASAIPGDPSRFELTLTVLNSSVFDIRFTSVVAGQIGFGTSDLSGQPYLKTHPPDGICPRFGIITLVVTSLITSTEATSILDSVKPGNRHVEFKLGRLSIEMLLCRTAKTGRLWLPNTIQVDSGDRWATHSQQLMGQIYREAPK